VAAMLCIDPDGTNCCSRRNDAGRSNQVYLYPLAHYMDYPPLPRPAYLVGYPNVVHYRYNGGYYL
jgi:hypothetical protein